MSLYQKLYGALPVGLQNVAVSGYGYFWKKRRFGGIFESELIGFKERENFSKQQWETYTTVQLQKVLCHAFETVPFYREAFQRARIQLTDLQKFTLSDMPRLPFLEKSDLRAFGKSTLVSSQCEPGGEFFASSGSTGTPTQILFSHAMHQRWSAGFEARIRHWAGIDRFTPRGMIGGRRVVPDGISKPPFYRYNYFEKQVYFSAYHISAKTVSDFVEGMKRYGIEYMTGYAMSNYFLARFIQERKIQAPSLAAVVTSSEKLTPGMRQVFGDVYGCKTYDSWSGVEACGLVSECEHGSLHISPDLGIIELLDDDGKPVKPGETGEVVCTGLINFDQPLIRYRIGDRMKLGEGNCPCGREMPIVNEIVGRVEDTVIGKDGRAMVRFHGIFVGLPNLIEAQVIQEDYDVFTIKALTTGTLSGNEIATIRQRMESQLGEIQLSIDQVSDIPRNANGKFQAVISKVKDRSIR